MGRPRSIGGASEHSLAKEPTRGRGTVRKGLVTRAGVGGRSGVMALSGGRRKPAALGINPCRSVRRAVSPTSTVFIGMLARWSGGQSRASLLEPSSLPSHRFHFPGRVHGIKALTPPAAERPAARPGRVSSRDPRTPASDPRPRSTVSPRERITPAAVSSPRSTRCASRRGSRDDASPTACSRPATGEPAPVFIAFTAWHRGPAPLSSSRSRQPLEPGGRALGSAGVRAERS